MNKQFLSTRSRALGVLAALFLLAVPAAAHASSTQETIMQDDPQILGSPSTMVGALATMKQLGVDRVRVSLFWDHVAPAPRSKTKPKFPSPGAGWPGSYPANGWAQYDRIVFAAQQLGIGILFTITGPGPAWAASTAHKPAGIYRPSASAFKDFVRAAAIRYSGAYPATVNPAPPRGGLTIGGITIGAGQPVPPPSPDRIPRVSYWSIWNEPNYPAWLKPIWLGNHPKKKKDMVAASPAIYRGLVDGAWSSLQATGHNTDTILIGETSPRGGKDPRALGNAMEPAEFARELYCMKTNFQPYTGKAARQRACPANGAARHNFRARHPGLFNAGGYAVHPYSLNTNRWEVPTWKQRLPDNVPIGNLGRLTRTLDRAAFYWGSLRPPMSIWFTEYGYQTKPQDPFVGVAVDRQGPLTSWGEYLAYRNPRVAAFAQFLLVDDGPVKGISRNKRSAWVSWQSGLFDVAGHPKPFLQDFQRPLHVIGKGRNLTLFGAYRPGNNGTPVAVYAQYLTAGKPWQTLATAVARNPRAYVNVRIHTPGPGFVRLLWIDPSTHQQLGSRPEAVK